MIGEKIVVETKAGKNDALLIEIDNISDYFIVRKGTRNDEGTRVTIELKKEAQEIDVYETVQTYARHLEIPILVRTNGKEQEVEDVGYPTDIVPPPQDLKFAAPLKIDTEGVEGIVRLFLLDTKTGAITAEQLRSLGPVGTTMHFISYEGIFVNNDFLLPNWSAWATPGIKNSDLNFKGHSVDLTVGRNGLVENHKLVQMREILQRELIQGIHNYLGGFKGSHSEVNSKFYDSNEFIEAFINFGEVTDREMPWISSLYRDFYHFKCPSKSGLKLLLCGDIVDAKRPIVVFHSVPNTMPAANGSTREWHTMPNTQYLNDVMNRCNGFTEDELYILPDFDYFYSNDLLSALLSNLFSSYVRKGFLEYFEIEKGEQLGSVLPPSWIICTFSNYDSDRFIEFEFEGQKYLNDKNRFVKLLTENHQKLNWEQKELFSLRFRKFCESCEAALRNRKVSDAIQQNQLAVLEIFVSAGLLPRNRMTSYLI